jgi:undecaprenyl-diphosphatase
MGETLLNVLDGGLVISGVSTAALVAGFVSAFVVGCLACRFMIDIVKRGKLIWFAVYCAVVGVIAIGSYIL